MMMFSSSSSTKRSTLAVFAMMFFICIASFASAARISPATITNKNNIPAADLNGLIPRTRIPAPAGTTTGPVSARLGASGNWFVHSSVRSFLLLYVFLRFVFHSSSSSSVMMWEKLTKHNNKTPYGPRRRSNTEQSQSQSQQPNTKLTLLK